MAGITASHQSDVSPSPHIACDVCQTVTCTTVLPSSFCVSCGSHIGPQPSATPRDERPPSGSAVSLAAMQEVVAVVARYHTRRLAACDEAHTRLQCERDEFGKRAIVLEAQVEALRRLLRHTTTPASHVATIANAPLSSRSPTDSQPVKSTAHDAHDTARPSPVSFAARTGAPPPHFFSQPALSTSVQGLPVRRHFQAGPHSTKLLDESSRQKQQQLLLNQL